MCMYMYKVKWNVLVLVKILTYRKESRCDNFMEMFCPKHIQEMFVVNMFGA